MEKFIIEEGATNYIEVPVDYVINPKGEAYGFIFQRYSKATIYDNNGVEYTTKSLYPKKNGQWCVPVDPNCNLNGYTKIKFKYSVEDNSQTDGIYTREGIVDFAEIENHNLSIPIQWNERAYDTYIPNHDQFATKEDLNNINIPDVDLSNYYDKQGTNNKIAEYLTNASFGDMRLLETQINAEFAKKSDLGNYALKSEIPDMSQIDLSQVETNKNNIQAMQDSFNDINSALDMILNG